MARARKTTKKKPTGENDAYQKSRKRKNSKDCYDRKKKRMAELKAEIDTLDVDINDLIGRCRQLYREGVALQTGGYLDQRHSQKMKELKTANQQVENLANEFERFNAMENEPHDSPSEDAVVPGTSGTQ